MHQFAQGTLVQLPMDAAPVCAKAKDAHDDNRPIDAASYDNTSPKIIGLLIKTAPKALLQKDNHGLLSLILRSRPLRLLMFA